MIGELNYGTRGPQGPKGEDGSQVSVSATGTSTNTVRYITIDDVEYKMAGGGTGGAVDSVNGKIGDVVLTYEDVGALSDETTIPTKTSDLTNDSGFLTEHQSLANYSTTTQMNEAIADHHDESKQNLLTAGSNITITGSSIAATDTTYEAGNGLQLVGDQFSVDTSVVATQTELAAKSTVSVSASGTATDEVQYITIDGVQKKLAGSGAPEEYVKSATVADNTIQFVDEEGTTTQYAPTFSTVSAGTTGSATTEIGYLTIDGTEYKLPFDTSGEPVAYIKEASVNGDTLTLTKKDNTQVDFTKPSISVAATGTATDTVQYITLNGVEKKIGGETYSAGTGIDITNNTIGLDSDTQNTLAQVEFKSQVSASSSGSSTTPAKYLTIDDTSYKLATGATNYYSQTEPTEAIDGDLWTYNDQTNPDYIKSASVNSNKLTLVDQDDTQLNYEPIYYYEGTYSSTNPITTKSYVDGKLTSVLTYKGSCNYANLPTSGMNVGDVWDVLDAHGTYPAGTNYAWTGSEWSPLGGSMDLSGYYTSSQVETKLATKQDKLTAGTGISISNNVITNTVNSSNFATTSALANKVSKTGDTITGQLKMANLTPAIIGSGSTGHWSMQGGSSDGSYLMLNGKSSNTDTQDYGGFCLAAADGYQTAKLQGIPNGKLFWNGDTVLTSAGGVTVSTPFWTNNSAIACASADTSNIQLWGGSAKNNGANLMLSGKDRSGSQGYFTLTAKDSSTDCSLIGTPGGYLTWGGDMVAAQITEIPITAVHNKIDWVRANVYLYGQLVTVNLSFRAKGTIAQSAYILSGFPLPISIAGGEGMEVIVIFGSGYRKAKLWDDGRMQMSTGSCTSGNVYTMNFSYMCEL